MKVVLLAGGFGSRISEESIFRPKYKNVLRDMLQRNMPEETGAELTEMQAKIKNVIDGLK